MEPRALIADRALAVDASGIRRVFDLAAKLPDPINLSIGLPDFDVPGPAKTAAIDAITGGHNRYTQTQGIAPLRERLRADLSTQMRRDVGEVLITSGVSGALLLVMLATINPGDEAIFLDPYFVMYRHLLTMAGGRAVAVDSYPDFGFPADRVEAAVTPRTKMLILNSPANPTGVVLGPADVRAAVDVARRHGLLIVSDEIYEPFLYGRAGVDIRTKSTAAGAPHGAGGNVAAGETVAAGKTVAPGRTGFASVEESEGVSDSAGAGGSAGRGGPGGEPNQSGIARANGIQNPDNKGNPAGDEAAKRDKNEGARGGHSGTDPDTDQHAIYSPAEIYENTLVLRGFSKSHAMTGWRVGYVVGPTELVAQMTKLQQYTFVCAPSAFQYAALASLEVDMSAHHVDYAAKRDMACHLLGQTFEIVRPGGAFYVFPKVPDGQTATAFVEKAIARNVLIIPGGVFSGRDTHFRVSYATTDAKLRQGCEILCDLA